MRTTREINRTKKIRSHYKIAVQNFETASDAWRAVLINDKRYASSPSFRHYAHVLDEFNEVISLHVVRARKPGINERETRSDNAHELIIRTV